MSVEDQRTGQLVLSPLFYSKLMSIIVSCLKHHCAVTIVERDRALYLVTDCNKQFEIVGE
jgi:hypothetical protein